VTNKIFPEYLVKMKGGRCDMGWLIIHIWNHVTLAMAKFYKILILMPF